MFDIFDGHVGDARPREEIAERCSGYPHSAACADDLEEVHCAVAGGAIVRTRPVWPGIHRPPSEPAVGHLVGRDTNLGTFSDVSDLQTGLHCKRVGRGHCQHARFGEHDVGLKLGVGIQRSDSEADVDCSIQHRRHLVGESEFDEFDGDGSNPQHR